MKKKKDTTTTKKTKTPKNNNEGKKKTKKKKSVVVVAVDEEAATKKKLERTRNFLGKAWKAWKGDEIPQDVVDVAMRSNEDAFVTLTVLERRGESSYAFEKKNKKKRRDDDDTTMKMYTNTQFVCPKCGERKTHVVWKQRRGMDEAPTAEITCGVCSTEFIGNDG